MLMQFLVAVGVLALLQAGTPCYGVPVQTVEGPDRPVRSVGMLMPSAEERRAGARPRGGTHRHPDATSTTPPKYTEPRVPQPDNAGVATASANSSLRINNGADATAGQFPWMLSVLIDDAGLCGASIIAEQWVLTAAHCVDGAKQFTITAGSLHWRRGSEQTRQVVAATKYFRHPDYNPDFVDNDIGIIQPSTAFQWNSNVRPVRLPSYAMGADMMTGKTAIISGWGRVGAADTSETLKFVEMVIDSGDACFREFGNVWIPTKICFDTKNDKKSPCPEDSGGPLIIEESDGKWTEIGLSSFGSSEGCNAGLPVAFTRVASFLEFIETTTNIVARD